MIVPGGTMEVGDLEDGYRYVPPSRQTFNCTRYEPAEDGDLPSRATRASEARAGAGTAPASPSDRARTAHGGPLVRLRPAGPGLSGGARGAACPTRGPGIGVNMSRIVPATGTGRERRPRRKSAAGGRTSTTRPTPPPDLPFGAYRCGIPEPDVLRPSIFPMASDRRFWLRCRVLVPPGHLRTRTPDG